MVKKGKESQGQAPRRDLMGGGVKKKKKNKGKKGSGSFQVVSESGPSKPRPVVDDEDDDGDAEAIRAANALAVSKRQKQAQKAEKQKALQAAGEGKKKKKKKEKKVETKVEGKGKSVKKKRNQREDDDEDEGDDDDDDEHQDAGMSFAPGAHDDEDDDDDDDEGSDFDELQVDFDFVNPKEEDFHGVKLFLKDLLDGEEWNSSDVADIILQQSGAVGTVIKVVDEPEDLYGVVSALSFRRCAKSAGLRQLRSFVLAKCPAAQRPAFEKGLGDNADAATALIINERMFNMPQELAVPLMQGLFDEIRWSKEEKAGKDVPGGYNFKQYLFLTRFLKDVAAGGAAAAGAEGKKKKQKSEGAGGSAGENVYVKAEDELVRAQAEAAFEFPLQNKEGENGMVWYGMAALLPASRLPAVLQVWLASIRGTD